MLKFRFVLDISTVIDNNCVKDQNTNGPGGSALNKKRRRLFIICGIGRDAETGDVLPTSPVFCAVVHLFAPPHFPLSLKNIDFTGVLHVFLRDLFRDDV